MQFFAGSLYSGEGDAMERDLEDEEDADALAGGFIDLNLNVLDLCEGAASS